MAALTSVALSRTPAEAKRSRIRG